MLVVNVWNDEVLIIGERINDRFMGVMMLVSVMRVDRLMFVLRVENDVDKLFGVVRFF